MEHRKDVLEYISLYCMLFKTDLENEADIHYITKTKFSKFKDLPDRRKDLWEKVKHNLSNNPNALELLVDGYYVFLQRVSERIYNEHLHELDLNRCPKC